MLYLANIVIFARLTLNTRFINLSMKVERIGAMGYQRFNGVPLWGSLHSPVVRCGSSVSCETTGQCHLYYSQLYREHVLPIERLG